MAAREVERLTDEVATIAQGVGLPAAPGPAELEAFGEAIEADRAKANRLTGLQEQASGLRATLATVETRRDELVTAVGEREAEAAAARTTWQEWLGAHDLDTSYDRETAARVVDAVTAAKATVMAMRTLETRHQAQRAERESFEAQVAALADLLPEGVAADADPDGAAVLLAGRLASAIDGERARDALVRTQAERAEALTLAEEARAAATGSLDAFLVELEVSDPDELRAEVERSDHGAALEAKAMALTTTLAALSGPDEALAAFQADLDAVTDIADVRGEVEALDQQLADLATTRDTLNQEAGALRKGREEMEADAAATELRQRRADMQAQIEAAAERWTVLALARHLLLALAARLRGGPPTGRRHRGGAPLQRLDRRPLPADHRAAREAHRGRRARGRPAAVAGGSLTRHVRAALPGPALRPRGALRGHIRGAAADRHG